MSRSEASPRFVSTRSALAAVVDAVAASEQVGFDTEFISEGAYEPVLCLLQVSTPDGLWIVDPFALPDLGRFWEALTEPGREVVALAAREEIRFCLRYAGRPPARLFDPQIAAGLVGYGYPLSHTNLVRRVLGVQVAGGESFTDWRQRPLSLKQLEYAADDVRYLLPLREKLLAEAAALERVEWVEGECRRLVERIAAEEVEERWWRVSGSAGLRRRELAILRELWRWRDAEARRLNLPPRRVLRDELLVEIARRKASTVGDLFALRGLERGLQRAQGTEIVSAVQSALRLPESELPALLRRDDPPQVPLLAQFLALAANNLAAAHRVDPALLATAADLQELVRWRLAGGEGPEPSLLQGWRGAILGRPLLELLEGTRHLRIADPRSETPLEAAPCPAARA